MKKTEFLDILRQALHGEVSPEVVDNNIKYYDQYISSSSLSEEDILKELGDPRLIARSVIESEKAAKLKGKAYNSQSNSNERNKEYDYNNAKQEESSWNSRQRRNGFVTNLPWRLKLSIILFLLIIIFLIIFVGRIIIGFLFTFGGPILLILLIYSIFKKRR